MTYAVIGTGAIGGYYGAKLAQSGQEVHFLLHRDYDYVAAHGLAVQSIDGDFALPRPHIYNNVSDMPQADVVIVALKTTNNRLLPALLTPLIKAGTIVLLIQNGIGVEEDVQAMLPAGTAIAAGLAFICSAKTEPGIVRHQYYGHITIAPYSCPDEAKVERIVEDFRAAGVAAHKVEYLEARWKKAVWNMPFNGMTVALDATTQELITDPDTLALVRAQMHEVIAAAQACGAHNIDDSFAEKMIESTREMPPYRPSMKLDYDFQRPMETHYLYSRPIAIAAQHGCPMPRLEMLEAQLLYRERHYPQTAE